MGNHHVRFPGGKAVVTPLTYPVVHQGGVLATSYISEHSAEFYLVPSLKADLEKHFKYVAPLFPWINRETSKISKALHDGDCFRLLTMFPRRPKVDEKDHKRVFVTINRELLRFKEFAEEYGVPVIAGCPIATSFWELSQCSIYVWMDICSSQLEKYLNPAQDLDFLNTSPSVLSTQDIIKMVKESSVMDIDGFIEFLKESRYVQPTRLYGPRYKPVYFIIKEQ